MRGALRVAPEVATGASPPDRVLLVEDSAFFTRLIVGQLSGRLGIEVVAVATKGDALRALDAGSFILALVDLNLPDSRGGEVVPLTLARGIPTAVFTASFDEGLREQLLADGVLDVVLKDNQASLRYLIELTRRVVRNRSTRALVVDDSTVARRLCVELLERYQLQVTEAADGHQALAALDADPSIRLVITDHEMPVMNGFELVTAIRRMHDRDHLAVIGVSGSGGAPLSARFLKHGANDFIAKPYLPEELYTRVALNLDRIESHEALQRAATRDFLTGVLNRRSFFERGDRMLRGLRRRRGDALVAMLDVDHFKSVNDTYGHDTGDEVLVAVAGLLDECVRAGDGVVARVGGEEFAIVLPVGGSTDATALLDDLRERVAGLLLQTAVGPLHVTASIGAIRVAHTDGEGLGEALRRADANLYAAKSGGRDCVVC